MSAKWDATLADLRATVASADPAAAVDAALDAAADQVAELTASLKSSLGQDVAAAPVS